ncbi:GIY-YIG nuclease family protein [uncultured Brevundimonas sp.]|uniref:GIY-YIG nuclease family protein n=1 Tax=uncultured Brevundimonas sp. TaxID=213418 RepID=UPI0025D3E803|nr:GIY-YIG nuclease family protein [uncultured Brevundimonas sp.]
MTDPIIPMPVVSGVYFLFQDRALTYTGKSRNVYGRIDDHRRNGRQFDYALVAACPEQDAAWIETTMIKSFCPPENRSQKPVERVQRHRPAQMLSLPSKPPSDVLPSDPDMVVSMTVARAYAKHFDLSGRVEDAVKDGVIISFRNAQRAYRIRVGDLRDWCKGEAAARKAA